jgi:hypothetical protein
MRNMSIAPTSGPVITLDDARNILVNKLEYPGGLDLFLKVSGDKSRAIQIEGVDLSLAKKGVEVADGLKSDIVTVK